MNEKLASLLSSAQRGAVRAGGVVSDAAYGAKKRAAELASAARKTLRLTELEGEVDLRLRELGELLYATHTGHPTGSEVLLEKLREIDALRLEIHALNQTLGRNCPACGGDAENARDLWR